MKPESARYIHLEALLDALHTTKDNSGVLLLIDRIKAEPLHALNTCDMKMLLRIYQFTEEEIKENKSLRIAALNLISVVRAFDDINKMRAEYARTRVVRCSEDINELFRNKANFDHEQFHVAFLNRRNKVMHIETVGQGSLSGTVCDTQRIIKEAILLGASSIILCHNHPSGNLRPSHADEKLTKEIKGLLSICGSLGLDLLDHLIITTNGYYSFADEGKL